MIDFGEEEITPAQNANTNTPTQDLLDLNDNDTQKESNKDFSGLKPSASEKAGRPVQRKDSRTEDVEEFVDAAEK